MSGSTKVLTKEGEDKKVPTISMVGKAEDEEGI